MRLFLACPSDLDDARAVVRALVERLNGRDDLEGGRAIELIDWQRHVAGLSASGGPQQPTLRDDDVVIGLAWLRFDPPAGDGAAAGCSEQAFTLAHGEWQRGRRTTLFYRCLRVPASLAEIDGRALHRIQSFFDRLGLDADAPAPYNAFSAPGELETQLVRDLGPLLKQREATAAGDGAGDGDAGDQAIPEGGEALAGILRPGEAYEVAFLAISIVDHRRLVDSQRHQPAPAEALLESFHQLVASTAKAYGGAVLTWSAGGGTVIFARPGGHNHAVMTGLKVLHTLPIFNLDSRQNPLGTSIAVRAAAHDAVVVFRLPVSTIRSPDLDLVHDMERAAGPGELAISKRLRDHLDTRLKPHFAFKTRLAEEAIYACQLSADPSTPEPAELHQHTEKVLRQTARLRARLRADRPPAGDDEEPIGVAVDQTYALLNGFCAAFGALDEGWPSGFLAELGDTAAQLVKEELGLWRALRSASERSAPSAAGADLEALVRAAARRRSRPVIILAKLAQRCHDLARDGIDPAARDAGAVDDELYQQLDALLRADALDTETALTDLLLHRKRGLIALLTAANEDPRRRPLLDKLWQSADLVLLDDLYSIRDHRRAGEARVFDALTSGAGADGRFRVVRSLFGQRQLPAADELATALSGVTDGGDGVLEDVQIVWRCLVMGHPDAGLRSSAAFRLSLYATWQVISHPRIPLASLYAVGERINKRENEDAKRIFFDCIRARLKSVAESFRTSEQQGALTRMILLLLDFSFLVESGYFERFDDILGTFLARSQKAGLPVAYFENLRTKLESARTVQSGQESRPPSGLRKLPLTIQRRLASESRYLMWFVIHPDPRIASETVRHIGLKNVERVLRLREINGTVIAALLRKPELFTRNGPLLAALNHPKCSQTFATRHLPGLARSMAGRKELERLARNPSASPQVRSTARSWMSRMASARR